MSFKVITSLERDVDGYVAYNDELRIVASGETKEQALENFRLSYSEFKKDYPAEIIRRFKNLEYELVELE